MKILITGSEGFIGYNLMKALFKKYDVVGIDTPRKNIETQFRRIKEIDLGIFDVNGGRLVPSLSKSIEITKKNKFELENLFDNEKFDTVIHLAANAGVRDSYIFPLDYAENNLIATAIIADLCERYKVRNLIFSSSSSVYGTNLPPFDDENDYPEPLSIYGAHKRMCEVLLKSYANSNLIKYITCLRFFTVYGPWGRPEMAIAKFTSNIMRGEPINVFGQGDMERNWTYIDDIIDGIIEAIENPFKYEIINLGNNKTTNLMDMVQLLEKEIGKKAIIDFKAMQKGDIRYTEADLEKAKALLGFEPKISIEEGIKKYVDWYKTIGEKSGI